MEYKVSTMWGSKRHYPSFSIAEFKQVESPRSQESLVREGLSRPAFCQVSSPSWSIIAEENRRVDCRARQPSRHDYENVSSSLAEECNTRIKQQIVFHISAKRTYLSIAHAGR